MIATAMPRTVAGVKKPRQPVAALVEIWVALARRFDRRAARRALYALDDRMLRDLGITRCEIEPAIRGKLSRLLR